jgi:hypothetical protein
VNNLATPFARSFHSQGNQSLYLTPERFPAIMTANLRAYRPAVRPILTLRHRTARLQWARDHVNWQLRYWTLGLFRDESRFCVDFHDGRRRVWRMPGERYADCCVTEHDRFRGGSVMVWAGISIDGKTDLHMIAGNLSGVRYRD